MTIVGFNELMLDAQLGGYAVGYFESWNLESLLAIADAAESMHSPVLMGFSGIFLPHSGRVRNESLRIYATLGLEVCRNLSVPAGLVFNESPHLDWVLEAIDLGFNLVMFSDESLSLADQSERVRQVVKKAHQNSTAVEGEAYSLPGIGRLLDTIPADTRLTDVQTACKFVEQTNVDAFAVNVGQLHLHGRQELHLDLELLKSLHEALNVPLVLHGASSVNRDDLKSAIQLGTCKINVGSSLKQVYFEALRDACDAVTFPYNPYEIIGSGLGSDVIAVGRLALQRQVENYMRLFNSAGKA
jgi:fructose-bisphosphate aldolase, class II